MATSPRKTATTPTTPKETMESVSGDVDVTIPVAPLGETKADEVTVAKGIKLKPGKNSDSGQTTPEGFITHRFGIQPENFTPRMKMTINGMNRYIEAMRLGAIISVETGTRNQRQMLTVLRGALESQDETENVICFSTLVYMASRQVDTLFNEHMVARFIDNLAETDAKDFLMLMNIVCNLAANRDRVAALKYININETANRLSRKDAVKGLLAYIGSITR